MSATHDGDAGSSEYWQTTVLHAGALIVVAVLARLITWCLTEIQQLYLDMEAALVVERPIRTRTDLAEIPLVGPIFSFYCDITDVIGLNFEFVRRYVGCVPIALAVPSVYAASKTACVSASAASALVSLMMARMRY